MRGTGMEKSWASNTPSCYSMWQKYHKINKSKWSRFKNKNKKNIKLELLHYILIKIKYKTMILNNKNIDWKVSKKIKLCDFYNVFMLIQSQK